MRVLELKDLKLKEVVKTAAKCTGEYWDKLKEAVSDGAKVTINKLLEWARQLEPAAQGQQVWSLPYHYRNENKLNTSC